MPRSASRHWISGFTLVDLIITLLLLVTLAGVGGFYYQEFRDSQKLGIAANELDTFAKAVQAYELTTSVPVSLAQVQSYTSRGLPPLQFLVDVGTLIAIVPDPWGNNYGIDVDRGVVFSLGPKGTDEDPAGADDLRRAYRKETERGADLPPRKGPCDDDRAAPVIQDVGPTGLVDRDNLPVRCTYFDNVGGSINIIEGGATAGRKPKMYIDGVDADTITQGVLSRSSNQLIYTTKGRFTETEHTIVAQVEDGCQNIARRQWKFSVDVSPLTVGWVEPLGQIRKTFRIVAQVYNQGKAIQRWTLFLDSREIASGQSYSAKPDDSVVLVGAFDSVAERLTDGSHVLNLRVSKTTGHTEEFQHTFEVDNTPPTVRQITTKLTPGLTCLQAQRFTTVVAEVNAGANDNFQVAMVRYQFLSVDQTTGATIGPVLLKGVPMQPSTALPLDWAPDVRLPGYDDRASLFNSADESVSTVPQPNSAKDFKPVTLPQGFYSVAFQATDRAGNVSTHKTTCFVIDLQKGGIKAEVFLDGTGVNCVGLGFSEDQRHIHGTLAPTGFAATQETSGSFSFSILDEGKTPISTWSVVVDDNGPGGAPDGKFTIVAPKTGSDPPLDWVTSGSFLGKLAGSVQNSPLYIPDSGPQSLRRGNGTSSSAIREGPLRARIRYVSDTSVAYTTFTTLFVDNSLPIGQGNNSFTVKQAGVLKQLPENDILFAASNPTGATSGLEFGGIWTDPAQGGNPIVPSGIIRRVVWSLTKDGKVLINNQTAFPFNGSPCTTRTASFGISAGLAPGANGAMQFTTVTPGGLDGSYVLGLSVTDGAGLTTKPARNFQVDTLPPEVLSIRIAKPGGLIADGILKEIPCSQGPGTLTTIDGQSLRFSPVVADQFAIREVHYWLVPITTPVTQKSAPVTIPITGEQTKPNIPEQVVTRDTKNAPILPLPQLYDLQVEAVGRNRPNPGPLCTTRVSFKFLSNLAVLAPFDAASSKVAGLTAAQRAAGRTWISTGEQAGIASYLTAAFAAGSSRVYDYSGRNGRVGSDNLKLSDWLSANASNGTTDVLIILDSTRADAVQPSGATTPLLRQFLDSSSGTKKDGNVVVWVGLEPFTKLIVDPAIGSSEDFLITTQTTDAGQTAVFGASLGLELSGSNARQLHAPAGRPLAYLPSLYEFRPFLDFNGSGTGNVPNRWLRSGPHAAGAGPAASDWVLDRLFTSEEGAAGTPRGNAFVYRNKKSGGLFASFYGIGKDSGAEDRFFVTPTAYVIEEFLRNYVTGDRNPASIVKRIAFDNTSGALAPISAATSNPEDIVAYPSSSEGYTNLTSNSGATQDADLVDVSDDGKSLTLLSKDRSREGGSAFGPPAVPALSLFALDGGKMRILAKARTASAPIASASRARRGGSATLATRSDLTGVRGGSDLDRRAIFLFDGLTSNVTALTTGGVSFGDSGDGAPLSRDPHLAPDGGSVAFSSPNVYDTLDGAIPTAFTKLKTLASGGRGIFRYAINVGAGANYNDGWVTRSLGDAPVCARPRISTGGTAVVFEASQVTYKSVLNTQRNIYLASARPSTAKPWLVGAITLATAASGECFSPDMAESPVGTGSFPPIVFVSRGDFRGKKPNSVSVTDPSSSTGAVPAGALSFRSIYLFTGDFGSDLVQIASGEDADCLNPRISPDGAEVVFESAALTITAPVNAGPDSPLSHTVSSSSALNRVYRARIRTVVTAQGSPSSIVERITPDGVSIGPVGDVSPAVSR